VHIPGHAEHEPDRPFQHAERHYFEPGTRFPVWEAFGGSSAWRLCNDRRWPETYRVMGLQGAELILIGYNTPLHYDPDPTQNPLQSFHNHLVMQAGAYQNGSGWSVSPRVGSKRGSSAGGFGQIIAPSGQIVAQASRPATS
jgi:N-carbamoyl-D-amino-acid hydrolase